MHYNILFFFCCWIRFEKESRGYYGTARLWDDGIILPQDTRKVTKRCKLVPRPYPRWLTALGIFSGRSWVRVYEQPYPHSPADKRTSLVYSECNTTFAGLHFIRRREGIHSFILWSQIRKIENSGRPQLFFKMYMCKKNILFITSALRS